MVRKARKKSSTGTYHVMYRGGNQREVFHDEEDNRKFLEIFKKYKELFGLEVYAWCMMNNHVHLLIKEGEEPLGVTMKRIAVSYVSYYNEKYQTAGHLFQNRYHSETVETDEYFRTVLRYIHQNPVKAGMVERADEWKWSSCAGYYGQPCFPGDLLDQDKALRMFSDDGFIAAEKFKEFNEQRNEDECLEDLPFKRRKLPDDAARLKIKDILGCTEIAQVKSLRKAVRDPILREIKNIDGLSQRQAARILGIPPSLIFKA